MPASLGLIRTRANDPTFRVLDLSYADMGEIELTALGEAPQRKGSSATTCPAQNAAGGSDVTFWQPGDFVAHFAGLPARECREPMMLHFAELAAEMNKQQHAERSLNFQSDK